MSAPGADLSQPVIEHKQNDSSVHSEVQPGPEDLSTSKAEPPGVKQETLLPAKAFQRSQTVPVLRQGAGISTNIDFSSKSHEVRRPGPPYLQSSSKYGSPEESKGLLGLQEAQLLRSSGPPLSYTQSQGAQPSASAPANGLSATNHRSPLPGKQVSTSDIQRVQNYIEKCLQMYLSQKEVITQLQQQFKIEPCFTQLVWQKLEEQNQEFFKAYYTRLKLKDQIILFNHLLDEQVKMFQRMPGAGQMMPGPQGLQWRAEAGGSQAHPAGPSSQAGGSAGYPAPADAAPQAVQLGGDAGQLGMGEFSGMGMDGAPPDLPPDLAGIGQSLPFSGSEINLANLISYGSPGRGPLGSVGGDHVDLTGLPRNFSLSDLALDQVADGDHGLPRNISLSDLPGLDLDSGGEQA